MVAADFGYGIGRIGALGSASKIALFVAPVLVLLSYVLGPMPVDPQFWPGAVVMGFVATLVAALITSSGRSAWSRRLY
jgi:Ca2+:H+ antiporter